MDLHTAIMIAFVWFTCPRDYALLAQSVASVKALETDCRMVAVISDSEPEPQIDGIEVMRKTFDRGSHLDGIKATIGIAETLAEVAHAGEGLIVKIDSDMILAEPFWNQGGCAHKRHNATYMGLYAIPCRIAMKLPELIAAIPSPHHEATSISKTAIFEGEAQRIPMRTVHMMGFKPPYVTFVR